MPGLNVQVGWPDTEPCDGKRIERFVLAVECEVWDEADISRQAIQEHLFNALPLIMPDANGDEGGELSQVEAADLPSFYSTQRPKKERNPRG